MPGLVPGIYDFQALSKTWMAGTSPAMTKNQAAFRLNKNSPIRSSAFKMFSVEFAYDTRT